jgi:hypothetical protein
MIRAPNCNVCSTTSIDVAASALPQAHAIVLFHFDGVIFQSDAFTALVKYHYARQCWHVFLASDRKLLALMPRALSGGCLWSSGDDRLWWERLQPRTVCGTGFAAEAAPTIDAVATEPFLE